MNTVEFPVYSDPESTLWIVYDHFSFGAYLRVCSNPETMSVPDYLLQAVHGIVFMEENSVPPFIYLPSVRISSTKKKIRIKKEQSVSIDSEKLFFEKYMTPTYSPWKQVQRYQFAFQPSFAKVLNGNLHGQALCILESLGWKETMFLKTPSNHFLITCTKDGKDVSMLVSRCEKLSSNIMRCQTVSWSKTLFDRVDAILCISEDPVDRWRGYHWIPKHVILQHKIIPMFGYPGKSEFALRTTFTESIRLWSDEYFVSFDKLENELPSFYLQ